MRRPAFTALAALPVLLAGCSSSAHAPTAAANGAPLGGTSSLAPSLPPGHAHPSPGVSGAGAAMPGQPQPTDSAVTAQSSARPSAGATKVTPPSDATAPGTYTYDTSGTTSFGSADGTSTYTVTAVQNGVQHLTTANAQTSTEQVVSPRSTGTFLLALKAGAPVNEEFDFSPAALLVPAAPKVGASWSWHATSSDGKTSVSATNTVESPQTVTIGGRPLSTTVLQTHLVISGSVSYTADVTTWVSLAYHLPVKDHTVGHGQYGTLPFSTDITDVMRSVVPS